MSKIEKEKRMRKYRIIKFILKILVSTALLIGLAVYGLTSPIFNITEINIYGNEKFDKETYINLSSLNIEQNIFNFRKSSVISNIKQNSYVEEVIIKRKLPNIVEITIEERTTTYILETENNEFAYINNQGYILEKSKEKLPLIVLTGAVTAIEDIEAGKRLNNEDLERLQNVIQIKDAVENANIDRELNKININSKTNYILTFEKDAKEVHLGNTSDLSTKMLYMKYVLDEQEGVPGTIYLNQAQVYFSPK